MAELISTPRISAPHLDSFRAKTIRITGKVTQLRGETATIDASGPVTLTLGHDAHLTVGNAVEIVGKVNQDLSVKVLKATDMGRELDMSLVEAVVDATHRYKEIFYN